MKDKLLLSFVVFVPTLFVQIANAQSSCSDFIKYEVNSNEKVAKFEITPQYLPDNTFFQIVVYVTNMWKINMCTMTPENNIRRIGELYRSGQPLKYEVKFTSLSKEAEITNIALKTSFDCAIICFGINRPERNTKSLTYIFYPQGRKDHRKSDCEPYSIFPQNSGFSLAPESTSPRTSVPINGTTEICATVSPKINFTHLEMGGSNTARGLWPWLVAVYHSTGRITKFICGATLISKRAVLTAAHCLHDQYSYYYNRIHISMFMGRYDLQDYGEGPYREYRTRYIIMHPDYNHAMDSDADIAILITDRNVEYTDQIQPACLWDTPETIDEIVGHTGILAGWGRQLNGSASRFPKQIEVNIVADKTCVDSNRIFKKVISVRSFCASNVQKTGPCNGDSGGALMVKKINRWKVRGLVSKTVINSNLCDFSNYVVYTDVFVFKNWIDYELKRKNVL